MHQGPRPESGQSIVEANLQELQRIKTSRGHITLVWVPGHARIAGNEKANQAARALAQPQKGGQTVGP